MKTKTQKNRVVSVLSFLIILAFTFTSCQKEQQSFQKEQQLAQPAKTDLVRQNRLLSTDFSTAIAKASATKISQIDYVYLLGEEPFTEGPDKAVAPNGDIFSIEGSGTLSIHSKSVTGSGEFMHTNAAGTVLGSGTWTALQLLSFHSYGSLAPNGPAEFEGGRALIRIHLSPDAGGGGFDAILQIDCLIGDKIPGGAYEGVRVVIEGGLNFNRAVHGETLFIRQ